MRVHYFPFNTMPFQFNKQMLCANIESQGSMHFINIRFLSLAEKHRPSLKKKPRILFTQGYFRSCLLKNGPLIFEKSVFKMVNIVLIFNNYLPLWQNVSLYLNKLMNSYSLYVHLACGMSGLRQVLKSGSDILLSTLGNKYRYQWHRSSKNDLKTVAPCHSRCGTLKNPHCSMAMSAEYRSTFAALHGQWWRLHMSKKILKRD